MRIELVVGATLICVHAVLSGCSCNPSQFTTSKSDAQMRQSLGQMFPQPTTSAERVKVVQEMMQSKQITGMPSATSDGGALYIPITEAKCGIWGVWNSYEGLLVQFDDLGRLAMGRSGGRHFSVGRKGTMPGTIKNGQPFTRELTFERIEWSRDN